FLLSVSPVRYFILFPSPSSGVSHRIILPFPPREGVGSADGRTSAGEAPGSARHDRRAASCSRRPRFQINGNARLATLHVAILRPVPVLPVVRDSLRGRTATLFAALVIFPQDRVSWTSTRYGVYAGRGRHLPRSTSRTPHEAPLDERGWWE